MSPCEILRSALLRWADGDAEPDEALAIGRHLAECTVCRIVLAREHRLASAMAGLGDPVDVDESFLRDVMATLPAKPPRRRGLRRGLRLAGIALAAASLGAAVHMLAPTMAVSGWDWSRAQPLLDSATSPEFPTPLPRVAVGLALALSGAFRLAAALPESGTWWIVTVLGGAAGTVVLGSAAGIVALLAIRGRTARPR